MSSDLPVGLTKELHKHRTRWQLFDLVALVGSFSAKLPELSTNGPTRGATKFRLLLRIPEVVEQTPVPSELWSPEGGGHKTAQGPARLRGRGRE